MGALRPLYCRFCEQTLLSDDLEKCSACGRVGGVIDPSDESARLAALVAQKKAEPYSPMHDLGRTAKKTLRVYPLLKLTLLGLFCVGLGFAMIFSPSFRDNPSRITFPDVAMGSILGLVGLLIVGFAFYCIRQTK